MRRCTERAFTLFEMILGLAGAAIVFAVIFGVFGRAIYLREKADAHVREARLRARAVNVLRNDLRNARVSGGADRTLATTLECSEQSQIGGFPGYVKLTTTTALDDSENPSADVQEVEFYIVTDEQATDRKSGVLVRTTNRNLMSTSREKPAEERLLTRVTAMEVSFYVGSEWKSSYSYTESTGVESTTTGAGTANTNAATNASTTPLPSAVRVRILPAETAVNPQPIELVVPLMTQTILPASTT
jgi:type II secretory pathway component PulJ